MPLGEHVERVLADAASELQPLVEAPLELSLERLLRSRAETTAE